MDKAQWASRVYAETWARLGVSKLHGVGVIAIRPIPQGTVVFRYRERFIPLTEDELQTYFPNTAVRKLLWDLSPMEDGKILIAENFPRSVDIGSYMNTSNAPNIRLDEDGDAYRFIATRNIEADEELTWLYPI